MGISIWQLLIILAIVLLLFGAKRLRNIGTDLGEAVKGFRKSVKDAESGEEQEQIEKSESGVIEGEATKEKEKT
jgi:sec-independent protein translocase protein TatA